MQMTDTEILGKYNRSDDKKGVVQILADLNGCDKDTIQQILIQGGVPESEFAPKKRRKRQPPAVKEPEYKEAPAGKPDPAKATATMPPEDESLPLPFSDDDMGIGDDEYGGAMTGGEGVYDIHDYGSLAAGGFIPPYRTAEELLTEPEDMTDKERKRLERIKAIPESVRELCQTEVANLRNQVMELEKRSDEIIDFLNGEAV